MPGSLERGSPGSSGPGSVEARSTPASTLSLSRPSPGSSGPGSVEAPLPSPSASRCPSRHRGHPAPDPLKPVTITNARPGPAESPGSSGPGSVEATQTWRPCSPSWTSPGSSGPGSVEASCLAGSSRRSLWESPGSSGPGSVEARTPSSKPGHRPRHRGHPAPDPLKRQIGHRGSPLVRVVTGVIRPRIR